MPPSPANHKGLHFIGRETEAKTPVNTSRSIHTNRREALGVSTGGGRWKGVVGVWVDVCFLSESGSKVTAENEDGEGDAEA